MLKYHLGSVGLVVTVLVATVLAAASSVDAGLVNPETFQTYSLGDDLKIVDGWSGNVAGTVNADPTAHGIVAGNGGSPNLALELVDPGGNFVMYWQQSALDTSLYPLQRLSYDVLLRNGYVRSMVSQGDVHNFFAQFRNDGTVVLEARDSGGDWYLETLPGSTSRDTWYHVDLDLDFGNKTAKMRYGEVGGPLSSFTSALGANLSTTLPFRFLVNGTVRHDNISLTAIPEPSTFVLLGLGLAAMALLRLRRRT